MGEGSDRVNGSGTSVSDASREADHLRGDIGRLVDELDRRRHEAFDLSLQLRRHPVAAAAVVAGVAFLVGGAIAVLVRRRQRRDDVRVKARNVRRALGRMAARPDEFARTPDVLEKIAVAAGTAAASMLVKKALDRTIASPKRA